MNEALVFIIIMIATILEGILGALLVVPLYASTVMVLGYMQRKVLGEPPFDDVDRNQFVMPEEGGNPAGRKWGRRATDRVEGISIPAAEAASPPDNEARPGSNRETSEHLPDQPVPPAVAAADDSSQTGPASIMDDDPPSMQMSLQEKE